MTGFGTEAPHNVNDHVADSPQGILSRPHDGEDYIFYIIILFDRGAVRPVEPANG